jgi:hypothetical protein
MDRASTALQCYMASVEYSKALPTEQINAYSTISQSTSKARQI